MKDLENVVVGAITTKMPRNENGEIIDKSLHSDLINAVNEAFALYNVVGRSEQLCRHDWIDATNQAVISGHYSKKCGAIKKA